MENSHKQTRNRREHFVTKRRASTKNTRLESQSMTTRHTKIIVSSHVSSVDGTTKPFVKHLLTKFNYVTVIYHPFSDRTGEPSTCDSYVSGVLKEKKEAKNTPHENTNYILHILYNFYFILSKKNRFDLFVGIDCLNAFCGIILKRLKIVNKVILYTVDYAKLRYENKIMNNTYHLLDNICVKNSDFVWNVSKRICEVRRQQGLKEDKNLFVPNGVHINKVKHLSLETIDKRSFIYIGHLKKEKGMHLIINSFPTIVENIPNAHLFIIGDGPYRAELENLVQNLGLKNFVIFLGAMNHESILKEIVKHGIGLAPYTKEKYTFYCSPIKVKEYLAAGCPVIITDVPDISLDVKKHKLGFVVNEENLQDEFVKYSLKLIGNPDLYKECRNNALKYASNYDWDAIYDKSLKRVISCNKT